MSGEDEPVAERSEHERTLRTSPSRISESCRGRVAEPIRSHPRRTYHRIESENSSVYMHCVVEDVVSTFFFSTFLFSTEVALGPWSPGDAVQSWTKRTRCISKYVHTYLSSDVYRSISHPLHVAQT